MRRAVATALGAALGALVGLLTMVALDVMLLHAFEQPLDGAMARSMVPGVLMGPTTVAAATAGAFLGYARDAPGVTRLAGALAAAGLVFATDLPASAVAYAAFGALETTQTLLVRLLVRGAAVGALVVLFPRMRALRPARFADADTP